MKIDKIKQQASKAHYMIFLFALQSIMGSLAQIPNPSWKLDIVLMSVSLSKF